MASLTPFQKGKVAITLTASLVYNKNVHSFAMQIFILNKMLQQNMLVLGAESNVHDRGLLITIQPQPMTSVFLSFGAFLELGGLCQAESRGCQRASLLVICVKTLCSQCATD